MKRKCPKCECSVNRWEEGEVHQNCPVCGAELTEEKKTDASIPFERAPVLLMPLRMGCVFALVTVVPVIVAISVSLFMSFVLKVDSALGLVCGGLTAVAISAYAGSRGENVFTKIGITLLVLVGALVVDVAMFFAGCLYVMS